MKELLTYVAQNLVEHSEAVSVTESHTDGETVLELRVGGCPPPLFICRRNTNEKSVS